MPQKPEVFFYNANLDRISKIREGVRDLVAGALMYKIWLALGWMDMRNQTHRTVLGPAWSIIGTAIQVFILGKVYGALLNTDPSEGFPYIAAGLILWFFISACIMGGLSVFVSAAGLLKEKSLPISFAVYRYTYRLLVELFYKSSVFVLIGIWFGLPLSWNIGLALPGLVLLIANAVWVILLLGVIGARFRDIRELIGPLMLIAFLATPVLWHSSHLGHDQMLVNLNPFTHYLEIVRAPLLGATPAAISYEVVIALTAAGWLTALLAFGPQRNRIVFWL